MISTGALEQIYFICTRPLTGTPYFLSAPFLVLLSLWIKPFLKQFGFGCVVMRGGQTTRQMAAALTLSKRDRWLCPFRERL